jgi:uncharacterized repeat protein (TIGR03803 family)
MDSSGDLFGTTEYGGSSEFGSVFELAHGSSSITTLASFTDANAAANPTTGVVIDSSGNLFGTADFGGPSSYGAVFEIAHGTTTVKVLASFSQADPSGVVLDSAGNIFGTINSGGTNSDGSVFEIAHGTTSIKTVASFNGANGAGPGDVALDSSGDLFGATGLGGANGNGEIFEIAHGTTSINVLASFSSSMNPGSDLALDSNGNLFGGTSSFGSNAGAIYELAKGSGSITTLASFAGVDAAPGGFVLLDSNDDLFGPALSGGPSSDGAIFELAHGASTITVLASFNGGSTGGLPDSGLAIDSHNDLFGTTILDGANDNGVVFEATPLPTHLVLTTQPPNTVPAATFSTTVTIEDQFGDVETSDNAAVTLTASGPGALGGTVTVNAISGVASFNNLNLNVDGNYTLTATDSTDGLSGITSSSFNINWFQSLASFNGTDGAAPNGSVVVDSSGDIFGAAGSFGANNDGTIFEIPFSTNSIIALASFNGTDGSSPNGQLVLDSSGNLFGTAAGGGASSDGTIFELAHGATTITRIASFAGTNGKGPSAGMVMDSSGDLFGTAFQGGAHSDGTVFELPHGKTTITTIASFTGANGSLPLDVPVLDSSGDLFGTAQEGGANSDGTIFEIVHGTTSITLLASFNGTNGANPRNLAMDSAGNIFGTTYNGGSNSDGAAYELPHGSSTIQLLASLNGTNGIFAADAILDSQDDLFGTALNGGTNNHGTVFEVPHGSSSIVIVASFNGANGGGSYGISLESSGDLIGMADNGGAFGDGTVYEISPPAQLGFGTPPSSAAGSPISPSLTVSVEDKFGNVITTDSSSITLSLASGPGSLTVGSTTVANAINGVATFNNLVLDTAGTYTFTASDAGDDFTGFTSNQVTINAASPSKLVVTQPGGSAAGEPFEVQATIEDRFGNVESSDTSAVTLTVSPGTFAAGSVNVENAVSGVATFNNLVLDTMGNYTLSASDSADVLTGFTAPPIEITSAYSFKTVASFDNTNGLYPDGTLAADSAGSLFGTTQLGGLNGGGVVYQIAHGTNTVIPISAAIAGAQQPQGELATEFGGTIIYGTTLGPGGGYIYQINNPSDNFGSGASISLVAPFYSAAGESPSGGVIERGNYLIGTAEYGGTNVFGGTSNLGTVFEFGPLFGNPQLTALANFDGGNGATPTTGVIADASGDLFGTTESGGTSGDGTVFEIAAGSTFITPLASFTGTNGLEANGLILDGNGNLFGTTQSGGAYSDGVVFEIAHGSSSVAVLASFNGDDGSNPQGTLAIDSNGNLFGTTEHGGIGNFGTVFEVPHSSGAITSLLSFNSTDAGFPQAGLLLNSSGALFGTTISGGSNGDGTVFELAPAATQLVFTQQPATSKAGSAISPSVTVAVEDQYGNVITSDSSTITLSLNSGPGALGGTVSANVVNGVATFNNLVLQKAGTDTLAASDVADGLNGFNSAAFSVLPAAASSLVFTTQPSGAPAGTAFSATITIEDSFGNVETSDNSSVTLAANGPGTLDANSIATVNAVHGVATFHNLILDTTGSYTLSASDSADNLTGFASNGFTISPAPATTLVFTTQPAGATAGAAFGAVITIEDQHGNTETSDDSAVTLSSIGPGGLGGVVTVNAVNGIATFNDLILDVAGSYTLSASDSADGSSGFTSTSFNITASAASQLVFATEPASGIAGSTISAVVAVEDQYNNIVTTNSSAIALSINSGPGALGGTVTVNATNGVATFSNLMLNTVGGYTLSAADSTDNLSGFTSTSFNITPSTAAKLVYSTQPAGAPAGAPFSAVVTIEDQFGNVESSDNSTVTLAANGPGTLSGTVGINAIHGVVTFNNLILDTAGGYMLLALDSTDGLSGFTSNSFNIGVSNATKLVFATQPGDTSAGTAFSAVVEIEDQYGNVESSDNSEITVSRNSGPGALGGGVTVNAIDGVASLNNLVIDTAGDYTLSAADATDALSNFNSALFTITTAAPSQLIFTSSPTTLVAGTQPSAQVTIEDSFGNIETDDNTHVTVAYYPGPTGGGPEFYGLTLNAANGVADFNFSGLPASVQDTAGMYWLGATDAEDSLAAAARASYSVTPAAVAQLAFTTQPSGSAAGTAFSTVIDVEDQYGNIEISDNAAVTVSASGPAALAAGSTATVTAINGVATLNNLILNIAGNYTLSSSDSADNLSGFNSASFDITPATPFKLVFNDQPSGVTAGTAFSTAATVEDQFGNLETSDSSLVTLAANGPGLLGGTVSVNAVNGVASFQNLSLPTSGDYTISAADGALNAGMMSLTVGDPPGLSPGTGAAYSITSPPGPQTIEVTAGVVTLSSDLSTPFPGYILSVAPGAQVIVQNQQTLGGLEIGPGGKVDITNAGLAIDYGSGTDPIAAIAENANTAYDAGRWDDPGLTSSFAAGNSSFAVGYVDDTVDQIVFVKCALSADYNLDGEVDTSDFIILASNFSQSGRSFPYGDSNYDGVVNALDFNALATEFGTSSATESGGGSSSTALELSTNPVEVSSVTARMAAFSATPISSTAPSPTLFASGEQRKDTSFLSEVN